MWGGGGWGGGKTMWGKFPVPPVSKKFGGWVFVEKKIKGGGGGGCDAAQP